MKITLWSVVAVTGLTATATLPSALQAQIGNGSMTMSIGTDGTIDGTKASIQGVPTGQDQGTTTAGQDGANNVDPVQRIIAREAGDGKHAVVVVDSVRASEDDLVKLSQALRSGTLRVKEGGVRTVAGDSPEAKQYGAKADEKVILISTEPGTAAPADSSKAKSK